MAEKKEEFKQEQLFDVSDPEAAVVPMEEVESSELMITQGQISSYTNRPVLNSEDIMIPRLRLAQGLTEEVQSGDAKPGDWIVTGYPPSREITAVPMMFTRTRIYLDQERTLICKSDDGETGRGDPLGEGVGVYACSKCPLADWSGPKESRVPPACTFGYSYMMYIKEFNAMAVLDFKRTSINVGKQLNTMVASRGIASFAVKLSGKQEESKRGKYYTPNIAPVNDADAVAAAKHLMGG